MFYTLTDLTPQRITVDADGDTHAVYKLGSFAESYINPHDRCTRC
jgi:hypothetical protein